MANALITLPESELGPAMRRLNNRQRAFVMDLCRGIRPTDAARNAGYSAESDGHIRWQTHALRHNQKVQDAIIEESRRHISFMTPLYTRWLEEIARDAGHKDRRGAINDLLNRGPLHEVVRSEHKVEISVDEETRDVIALAKELGVDPAKIVGRRKLEAIDADFEEIDPRLEGVPL